MELHTREYLVPSRPRLRSPARRAVNFSNQPAHAARADAAEGLDDDCDDHVVLLGDGVVVVAGLGLDVAAPGRKFKVVFPHDYRGFSLGYSIRHVGKARQKF